MWARSMMRSERSCMPQSQATATLPAPSERGIIFQPVPRQRGQFSRAMERGYVRRARAARWSGGKLWKAVAAREGSRFAADNRELGIVTVVAGIKAAEGLRHSKLPATDESRHALR